MSETDDTDELILIPPDIYATHLPEDPFLSGPYFEVVDTLISQVNKLENRIHSIEAKSETSLTTPSKTTQTYNLMSNVRKHRSSDDVNRDIRDAYYESTQSTPQKPQTRVRCPPSRTNHFSPQKLKFSYNSPSRKSSKQDETKKAVLRDINNYICDIKDSINATNSKSEITGNYSKKDCLSLRDLDFMLRKVEAEEKQLTGNDERNIKEDDLATESATSLSTDVERITSYTDLSSSVNTGRPESDTSTETTQATAVPKRLPGGSDFVRDAVTQRNVGRAQSFIHREQMPLENGVSRTEYRRVRGCLDSEVSTSKASESTATMTSESGRLYSLSNLWRQGDYYSMDMPADEDIFQKLEEERVRRQHCEQIIQQLQTKVLELQERVAVAVQVDAAKDDAILRFHKAWEQVAGRLQSLTQERRRLEEEIQQIQEQHSVDIADTAEKIERYESDAAKSAVLLQTTQTKNRELELLIIDLTNELKRMNTKCDDRAAELQTQTDRSQKLNDALQENEDKFNKVNNELISANSDIKNGQKAFEALQSELKLVKEKQSKFEYMVKERDSLIETLEDQNQKLLNDMETHKKIEKDLQKEVNKIKELSEQEKMDLKYFYQEQVEKVVKDKLTDFQVQLEKARNELEDDLKKREVIVAKTAATHIQQIADKHNLEIRLLEEKHMEEVRLYQVQLGQTQQLIDNLQKRLQHQQLKKQDMAKQLHKLMEAQWLEALKIINNGKSPSTENNTEHDLTKQLNHLKSQSYTNVEEMLSTDFVEEQPEQGFKHMETNFNSNPRMDNKVVSTDTPLTSRPRKQEIEEIQKYIHMLLHKPPGSPVPDQNGRNHQEIPTWQPQAQDDNRQKSVLKDRKLKPPWK